MPAEPGLVVGAAIRWAGILALAGLSSRLAASRGPLTLAAPRTIYSNAHPAQKGIEAFLLLLKDACQVLPPSATVVVLPADPAFEPLHLYLIAEGQLPDQRVLPWYARGGAEFLLCYGAPCGETGFQRVRDYPDGSLFRRIP